MDDEPLLRTVSEPVEAEDFGERLNALLRAMVRVAAERGALGIAAVQIGVPVRALLIGDGSGSYLEFINPRLDRTLRREAAAVEGCLSIPKFRWASVSRPAKCDATWQDAHGEWFSRTLTGGAARIFQHEFDHLNGVLMTDHMPKHEVRVVVKQP
jgi:peptide deformylase